MTRSSSIIATAPGATIKEQLVDRGMSQKEFAARMDLSEKHVSKLINGDVQLTPEVAVRLEIVLGVPAKFWNNLEAIYREKLIKVSAENAMKADEELARQLPYSEMARLGWVPQTRKSKEKVVNLRKFFEVVDLSLLENNQITKIACRRLAVTQKSDFALMAWAQEAKIAAREIYTEHIDIKGLSRAIPTIRQMTIMSPEVFCSEIKATLSNLGIAIVFLPHLRGSFLQGASFIDGNKVVLGITARGRDGDKFWFSLFHELAHIILGHIGQANGTSDEDEDAADAWARDALIDCDEYEKFVDNEDFSEYNIKSCAAQLGIAPGILVGRLQKDGYIKYNALNNLKTRYDIV